MNWRGEIPRATPLSAFLVGLVTGGALQWGLRQDLHSLPGQFTVSLLLASSIVLWFGFVVRGREYEFKWWYG
ncbi:MAG: hypothetical protein OQK99_11870, partial [Gammaproteobacteria bacterium]|nr:hypothetical protein [Gammaproteobacteria bacterium]